MENINNSYFDGHYKDIWKTIIPAELTVKETEFLLQYFKLQPGNKVLDLMCGYGRHALALAKHGVEVTAVDNLESYTNEIREAASKENLPVTTINSDVIQFTPTDKFDLVICMGNSFNFFDANESNQLLTKIFNALKKDGQLLIHTWSLTEIAIQQFKEKTWSDINGLKYLTSSQYLFSPTRIESETTIISPDGKSVENKLAIDYIFSVAEMHELLNNAGFTIKEIYSIPGRKQFKLGDPRAYIVAQKK